MEQFSSGIFDMDVAKAASNQDIDDGRICEFVVDPFGEDSEACRILALCVNSDSLGIAIYLETENIIKVSQDISSSHSEMAYTLESLKSGLIPTLIITTKNIASNTELLSLLIAPLVEGGEPFPYQILKNSYWEYSSAIRSACANLRVRELLQKNEVEHSYASRGARDDECAYNLLSGSIDFNAIQSIRALGALISHLQATVFSLEVDGTVPLLAIQEVDYLSCLRIDALSLRSLGIFCEESHPNVLRGRGRSKEGFSVFALYDRTRSVPGRRCLREWFSRPSSDINVIQARQDGIELLMRPEHAELVRAVGKALGRGFDTPRLLLRVKRVTAGYADWCRIVHSAEAAIEVHDALAVMRRRTTFSRHITFLDTIIARINATTMKRVAKTLSGVIDVEASMEEKELVLKHGLSPQLDNLRATFGDLHGILHAVGGKVLHDHPLLDELSVEYVPQVGYLVALAGRSREFVPPEFQFAFAQGDNVFYKSEMMLQLDAQLGDIQADIADCQASLVRELEDYLLSEEVDLQRTSASLAELDAVLSLASAAVDLGLVRPNMVEENVVVIKAGRHPLQELVVDAFIPNDTLLASAAGGTVALITGANYSGKSVYLKQVGVLVFLAHVGSFLPCEKAIIGLTDRIFTRILTVESCSLPQSSFTIDMVQCSKMIRHATPRSLLLIDEFGKGTNATDGAALLTALIRELAGEGRKARCKALLTLHFLEVFRQGLVGLKEDKPGYTDLPGVSAFHMEVHVPESNQHNKTRSLKTLIEESDVDSKDDPVPLFKLVPGVTHTSHGFACARMGNLPEAVIRRAVFVMATLVGSKTTSNSSPTDLSNEGDSQVQYPRKIDTTEENVKTVLQSLMSVRSLPNGWINVEEERVKSLMQSIRLACRNSIS